MLLVGALRETLVAARAFEHTLARQRLGAALHALQVTHGAFNLPPLLWVGGVAAALPVSCRRGYRGGKGEEDVEGMSVYPRGH